MDSRSGRWFPVSPRERDAAEVQAGWEALWPEPAPSGRPLNRFTVLRFHVPVQSEQPFFAASDLVVPVIDGTPFFEMLGGGWPGIPEQWVLPPSRQWLGSPEQAEYGRAIVLDGSCGDAGCCGVMARISVLSDTVIWDEFYGLAPDLPEPLRFEFDRVGYEEQLAALPHVPVTEWDDAG
jgi:hypothetical protein